MNHKSILSATTHLFTLLGVNAVPALGVFAGGWPAETAMLIYLLETLAMIALSALRVRLLAPACEETAGGAPSLLAGVTVTTTTAAKSSKVSCLSALALKINGVWQTCNQSPRRSGDTAG